MGYVGVLVRQTQCAPRRACRRCCRSLSGSPPRARGDASDHTWQAALHWPRSPRPQSAHLSVQCVRRPAERAPARGRKSERVRDRKAFEGRGAREQPSERLRSVSASTNELSTSSTSPRWTTDRFGRARAFFATRDADGETARRLLAPGRFGMHGFQRRAHRNAPPKNKRPSNTYAMSSSPTVWTTRSNPRALATAATTDVVSAVLS